MTTDIHKLVSHVEASDEFLSLPGKQFLAHVFFHDKPGGEVLQVGYYDVDSNMVTAVLANPLRFLPPDKVFSESGEAPQPLDLSSLVVGLAQARSLAADFIGKERPHHPVSQSIFVLQQAETLVWAVTLVTSTMHMLQIRIDATCGEVSLLDATSLLDFGQKL